MILDPLSIAQQSTSLPLTSFTMRPADFSLLLKKIVIGVVIAAIPLLIITSGLWLTRILLDHPQSPVVLVHAHAHR